jgi:hypothetical protein
MYKKIATTVLFLSILMFNCFSITINYNTKKELSGVWNFFTTGYEITREFSWGKTKVFSDGSVIIDLSCEKPCITANQMEIGIFYLEEIIQFDTNTWLIKGNFSIDEQFNKRIIIQKIGIEKILIFEENNIHNFLDWSGMEHPLARVFNPYNK